MLEYLYKRCHPQRQPKVKKKIKVLIVDDHGLVRQGIRSYLERHDQLLIIGEASSGAEALKKISSKCPDVLLLDINLPDCSGFKILEEVREKHPKVNVVVVTVHKASEYIQRAIRLGAKGYILKEASPSELALSIETVFNNQIFITPILAGSIIKEKYATQSTQKLNKGTLSSREIDVIKGIANGRTSKEIAQELNLSVRTIQTHRERIIQKLGIRSVAGLTRYAIENLHLDTLP